MISKIVFQIFESIIRNISGVLGQKIRYFYYKYRLKSCGKNVRIEQGVIFENPNNIIIGDNVFISANSILTARPLGLIIKNRILKIKKNIKFKHPIGQIIIGNEVHIGAFNIIQGYGGIEIKDRVTTSARVSIYSFSHMPTDSKRPHIITYANAMVNSKEIACIQSPIILEDGVWLGLNSIVFAGNIGRNSFVSSNSIVLSDFKENSFIKGDPAIYIKNRFKY